MIGAGESISLLHGPSPQLRSDVVQPFIDGVRLEGNTAFVRSGKERFPVAIRSARKITVDDGSAKRPTLQVQMDEGAGFLLLAYSDKEDRAAALIKKDPEPLRAQVAAYYKQLLSSSRIETPDPQMNRAFRSAIYNLEYNWIAPHRPRGKQLTRFVRLEFSRKSPAENEIASMLTGPTSTFWPRIPSRLPIRGRVIRSVFEESPSCH